jgi:hypothetical protein
MIASVGTPLLSQILFMSNGVLDGIEETPLQKLFPIGM